MKSWDEVQRAPSRQDCEDRPDPLTPTWTAVPGCLPHAGCNGPSHLTFFTRGLDGRRLAICASCGAVMDMEQMRPVD